MTSTVNSQVSDPLEVYTTKDIHITRFCSLCENKPEIGKTHLAYKCLRCVTLSFICNRCMCKEIVQIKRCGEQVPEWFALNQDEKILKFDVSEVRTMLAHGDVALTERSGGGTAMTYTKK